MKQFIKWSIPAVLAMALSFTAGAVGITGGISLSGGPITVNNGDNLATATSIISYGNVLVSSTSGPGTTYFGLFGTPVPINNGFTFAPFTTTVSPLWSFTVGGETYSFDLSSIQSVSQGNDMNGNGFLLLSGMGTLFATGSLGNYDPTPGSWSISANSAQGSFSFSTSNGAQVPDGAMSLTLLGGALSGLALIKRKLMV